MTAICISTQFVLTAICILTIIFISKGHNFDRDHPDYERQVKYQNCLESHTVYSHFLISHHQTAVEVFEVLSVVMTSSLEVVRTKKIWLILGFSDLLNSILNRSESILQKPIKFPRTFPNGWNPLIIPIQCNMKKIWN